MFYQGRSLILKLRRHRQWSSEAQNRFWYLCSFWYRLKVCLHQMERWCPDRFHIYLLDLFRLLNKMFHNHAYPWNMTFYHGHYHLLYRCHPCFLYNILYTLRSHTAQTSWSQRDKYRFHRVSAVPKLLFRCRLIYGNHDWRFHNPHTLFRHGHVLFLKILWRNGELVRHIPWIPAWTD